MKNEKNLPVDEEEGDKENAEGEHRTKEEDGYVKTSILSVQSNDSYKRKPCRFGSLTCCGCWGWGWTTATIVFNEAFVSFASKPRILYAAVFCWLSLSGGRFTAPFLVDQLLDGSDHNAEGRIGVGVGTILGLQSGAEALLAPWLGGRLADRPTIGHAHVMAAGVALGTLVVTLGHSCAATVFRLQPSSSSSLSSWNIRFLVATILRLGMAVSTACVFPALDGLTLQHLGPADRADYGKERLHGAIWWAVVHALMGPLVDWLGFRVFYLTSVIGALLVGLALRLYKTTNKTSSSSIPPMEVAAEELKTPTAKTDAKAPAPSSGRVMLRFVRHVCGTAYGAGFLGLFFILNTGTSVVEHLVFLYFGEVLGGSNTICGFTVVVTVAFEIPIFGVAGPKLLRGLGGPAAALRYACLAYAVRVFGYAAVPAHRAVWVLGLEPLHGVTYAFAQCATVEFLAAYCQTHRQNHRRRGDSDADGFGEASAQSLASVLRGLGNLVGLGTAGALSSGTVVSPRAMYRGYGMVVLVATLAFEVVRRLKPPPQAFFEEDHDQQDEEGYDTSMCSLPLSTVTDYDRGSPTSSKNANQNSHDDDVNRGIRLSSHISDQVLGGEVTIT